MPTDTMHIPDQLPILSRGKHRNPRKGACFMELASFLAGERWSDHPACTHPLLAALARHVNDQTSADGRSRLAVLIPSVIGVTGSDLRLDVRIALRCARTALPVAAADRQRVMAVSILSCERMLDHLDGRPPGSLEDASRRALRQVPHAEQWARDFIDAVPVAPAGFRRLAAPNVVATAVDGIAKACISDPDALLYDLLVGAIDDCRRWIQLGPDAGSGVETDTPAVETGGPAVDSVTWAAACQLTGAVTRR